MSKVDDTTDLALVCPECGSENVATYAETAYLVNTGEFYCHSVKAHDSDAKAVCLACWWRGQRADLVKQAPA